jgi:non-specific serine/threonine protein kinase
MTPTSLVGRQRELAAVKSLLAPARLVTLTGPAGCGKTRLALRVAGQVAAAYADGVHWVELAALSDAALVPQAIARAVHVPDQPGRPVVEGLQNALRHQHLLLVLDNCEHVLPACAALAAALLRRTAIAILATSREPLGVAGEQRYPVPPLELPPVLPWEEIAQSDAVQLFVERAQAILPAFALTPDNAAAIAAICRRLEGIPLAIELASARVNILTLEQIATRLSDSLDLLGTAPHVTYSHHHSLRAAIDWSYELLSPAEQALLRRLSVFAGGASLTTAAAVCAGPGVPREQVLDLLASLVDKSLVLAHTLQAGEARYTLLDTIRQYAQEKLRAAGERAVAHDPHLQCFLALTEETAPKLSGPDQQRWLDWLEGEYDNVRSALGWALESQQIEAGLRIAVAIYPFWTIRDYVQEGLTWVERLLAHADESVALVVRAHALAYAAFLAGFRAHTAAQLAYGQKAAALAETARAANTPGLAPTLKWALAAQAYGAHAAGDYQTELTLGRRVIRLNRELGDRYQLSLTLSIYSFAAMALGQYAEARAMLDESLGLLREAGDPYRVAMALNFAGDLARCERQYARAQRAYEESLALLRQLGAVRDLASVLYNLGHTCLHRGDARRAYALFSRSLAAHLAQRNTPGVAECLIGFAALCVVQGLSAAAARLLAAAVALGGPRIASAWAATRLEYEHYDGLVHAQLRPTEFHAEQAIGSTLSLQQAVDFARSLPLNGAGAARVEGSDLTRREREVASLIAQGRSNGEIAAELVVSKRTVEKHIANILTKLGFTMRAQIVRWAMERGLGHSGKQANSDGSAAQGYGEVSAAP